LLQGEEGRGDIAARLSSVHTLSYAASGSESLRGSDQTTLENFPPLSAQILCPSRISKPRRPPPPHLTLSLEAIYHYLQLGLVLPEVPEVLLFLLWVVLTDPLR